MARQRSRSLEIRLVRRDPLGLLRCPWCPAVIGQPVNGRWDCGACGAFGLVLDDDGRGAR
jgi:hypothetical protein